MPIKHRVKTYQPGAHYHVYNRGLNGQLICVDDEDFRVFIDIVRSYACAAYVPQTAEGFKNERPSVLRRRTAMNMAAEVQIHAYCLMPDHFHLLLTQLTPQAMTQFMRRVMTRYVMHYNKRYKRTGPLFETNYRAVAISDGDALVHMTRFIHLNPVTRIVKRFGPVESVTGTLAGDYAYSSYQQYVDPQISRWIIPALGTLVGDHYRKFVEDTRIYSEKYIAGLTIDGPV